MIFNINTYKEYSMNIQPISTNYNTNFQSKLRGQYAIDMLDFAINNPKGSRKIVDGVRNILENGKNDIIELNYTGNKLIDKIFKGAYKITRIFNTEDGIKTEKRPWNYCFIGGGIGAQSEFALAELNNGKIHNNHKILDGMRKRLFDKQQEIFDEYDYNGGRDKVIKKLQQHYDYLDKKYSEALRLEATKLKRIIQQN